MSDNELRKLIENLQAKVDRAIHKKGHPVYTNTELRELLGVGDKLIKKYRDEGLLGFSRVGDKYFYSEKDVIKFLELNHYEAFAED